MAWVEQCGNRTWRVRYRRDDDTIGAVSGFTTKTAATEHANSLEADQREGRFLDPAAGQITLTEWSQDWLQALDVAIRTEDVKLRVRAGSTGRTNTRAARISTSQTARGMWSGTSSGTASGASSEIPWRIMRAAGDHQSPLASGMCSILEPHTVLATVLSAEVRRGPQVDDGVRMCWSNAGHPPPVVVRGGVSEILEQARPDPMLGLRLAVSRHDHELSLAAGDVVVMFTDGLVEERGEVIDEGVEWVRQTVEGAADRPAAEVCDVLMSRLADTRGDDDTALLVVRAREVAREARGGEALQVPVADPAKAVSGGPPRWVCPESC